MLKGKRNINMATPTQPIDEAKLHAFLGKVVADMGATVHGALMIVGDRLGLYKAMAGAGPLTPAELAAKTGTFERYIREWLNAHAAAGYVTYDPGTGKFELPPEQAFAMTVMDVPGVYHTAASCYKDEPKITEAFRTGKGVGWHEHDAALFCGTERFFRPNYQANLLTNWIPALSGVKEKLEKGGVAADVGCGHGASTILMAKAFPKSKFYGFDYHPASIEAARKSAAAEGANNATFEVSAAKSFPDNGGYDLVSFFDCLHDMGDPTGASKHVLSTLKPDGVWMIVEPFANDKFEENHNPVGRVFYAASTMICTPASLSQEVGLGLGAQAGEQKLREVVTSGGFTRFRRATETPFNLVLEARP
jgi:SAM-dependent methyltransferase